MEIEITTTKRKLTKSMLNQMYLPSIEDMRDGTPLGYLVNCVKQMPTAVLIHRDGEYRLMADNWRKGEYDANVYRRHGKWNQTKRFDSPEERDEWWELYKAVKEAAKTQIYI